MSNKIKIILGILVAILSMISFYILGWSFSPGSYSKAEIYEISLPEKELIDIINEVKEENPEIILPQQIKNDLIDGKSGKEKFDYWYHIYFYYPDKNQIVNTWTRAKSETSTSFAFVGINQGLVLGNWKDANESFWWWKNSPRKSEFEERILKLIKEKINNEKKQ